MSTLTELSAAITVMQKVQKLTTLSATTLFALLPVFKFLQSVEKDIVEGTCLVLDTTTEQSDERTAAFDALYAQERSIPEGLSVPAALLNRAGLTLIDISVLEPFLVDEIPYEEIV